MRMARVAGGTFGVVVLLVGLLVFPSMAEAAPEPQIPLVLWGTVAGRVTDARNGQPIGDIAVSLRYLDGSGWITTATATTDGNGRYRMTVPTGSAYRLGFWDPDGFFADRGWPTARTSVNGSAVSVSFASTTTCDATLATAAYVRMRLVTEATGGPIPTGAGNARDLLSNTTWGLWKDAQGWCTLRGMNPGLWQMYGITSDDAMFTPAYPYGTDGGAHFTLSAMTTTTAYVPFRHVGTHYKDVVRKAGNDRYETALRLANEAFPLWQGVSDVVVASGEDASAVDALSAAGLAGAYDAPLILVKRDYVPTSVSTAIKAMSGGVRVHIVGGPSSVSTTTRDQLGALPTVASVDRCYGANRYETAAQVARWMKTKLGSLPTTALIANGAQAAHYYDAIALSPVAYKMHYPIMLVGQDSVPPTTTATLAQLGLTTRYIAGGQASVSDGVALTLGVAPTSRLAGANRELTAAAIAEWANTNHYLGYQAFGLAANVPDALAAGAMMGKKSGVMLLTRAGVYPVSPATTQNLNAHVATVQLGVTCGGTNVIPENARLTLMNTVNH